MAEILKRLEGKVAIITGGSSGIGRGIARRFAQEGAHVAICSVDSENDLASIKSEIESMGRRALTKHLDVSVRNEAFAFVDEVAREFGALDILVNGAAYMFRGDTLEAYPLDAWDKSIAIGLSGAFHLMQAVFPHMRERGGRIVNITSGAGIRGVGRSGAYAAAKGGLIALSRVAAIDWASHGINVNCIAPAAMTKGWQEALKSFPPNTNPFTAMGARSNAFKRLGDPEGDIAPAVAFLCSSESKFITGAVLAVDGGQLEID